MVKITPQYFGIAALLLLSRREQIEFKVTRMEISATLSEQLETTYAS